MVTIQKVSHDKLEKKTWYNMTVLKLTNYLIYGVRGLRGRLEERGVDLWSALYLGPLKGLTGIIVLVANRQIMIYARDQVRMLHRVILPKLQVCSPCIVKIMHF